MSRVFPSCCMVTILSSFQYVCEKEKLQPVCQEACAAGTLHWSDSAAGVLPARGCAVELFDCTSGNQYDKLSLHQPMAD